MIIGSQTNYLFKTFGDVEGMKIMHEAGFGSMDLNLFDWTPYLSKSDEEFEAFLSTVDERYKTLKQEADKLGMIVGQIHAPFPTMKNDEVYDAHAVIAFKKSIEVCSIVGCHHIVIHPIKTADRIYDESKEETKKVNMDYFMQFAPLFQKYGVKLCVENMWAYATHNCTHAGNKIVRTVCSTAEEMCDYIDTLNELSGFDMAVACLDVGHSNLTGDEPWLMIKTLGDRLACLHLHDTVPNKDLHTAPYLGQIDWNRTFTALREINYKGEINFEAESFFKTFGPELIYDSTLFLRQIGSYLCKKNGLE